MLLVELLGRAVSQQEGTWGHCAVTLHFASDNPLSAWALQEVEVVVVVAA